MYILNFLLDILNLILYYIVMYITEVPTKTKRGKISHRCILLRESYREGGKVKNRTIANLTHCKEEDVAAMRLALKHKGDLTVLKSLKEVHIEQGMSVGAVWTVYEVGRRAGIEKALGKARAGKLAFWQVMARVIAQGSRLSAVRLAQVHAGCDVLGMSEGFNEEHLYRNLAWLSDNQREIEKELLRVRRKGVKPELFLYDVTSSYMEGQHNELADWGLSRDKKTGKKQVVIGLLCDEGGDPVSVEVFRGNVRDFSTLGSQIEKAAKEFGCHRVTFVGDRGMIKSGQISQIKEAEFHYITAITKPQIDKLLRGGVFQMALFDKEICEIEHEQVRYILRRNPLRAEEMARIRKEKKETIERLCRRKNEYLIGHVRAKVETAIKEVNKKIEKLKLGRWLKVKGEGRKLELEEEQEALEEESKLDGCYVIKSDLPKEIDKQILHDRYKDLSKVEKAFRNFKTVLLEMRPWFVQTEKSTRGHALVVMLSYLITIRLEQAWVDFDLTVEEGLNKLSMICSIELVTEDQGCCHRIPTPNQTSAKLLEAANVRLPKILPQLGARVVSRKKLQSRRKH
jgi:hypothetical protein